jgi:3-(3-hydroxy-phenyl)propionate hydroxylase
MARPALPVWRPLTATPQSVAEESTTVVVVGGGPVGLTLALDLGRRGHRVVLLNRLDFIAAGSKAICFSKRSLEIFDRLGVADALVKRGVRWNIGKVFAGDSKRPVYQFDLLPVKDQKQPAFINIQQYHVEEHLIGALAAYPNVEARWGHSLAGLGMEDGRPVLEVETATVRYRLRAEFLVACDGARSTVRDLLNEEFSGDAFEDHFLIADIRVRQDRPAERWFWFDPPFNRGRSALLHKQPDDVWRLDFQLGPNIDRAAAIEVRNVERYVRGMLGDEVQFDPVWYSLYTFKCCRMRSFVHGPVIFAGDAAHLVSLFGARGCNGGIADAFNLGWKLDLILRGDAPRELLRSYDLESLATADENIRQATRATRFMSSKSRADRALRDAVLELAAEHEFARPFVNSGRLSSAVPYPDSPLNVPDTDAWGAGPAPGELAVDAPYEDGWLCEALGSEFTLLADRWAGAEPAGVRLLRAGDHSLLRSRYELEPGSAYLMRPDQYVLARWKHPTASKVGAALRNVKEA